MDGEVDIGRVGASGRKLFGGKVDTFDVHIDAVCMVLGGEFKCPDSFKRIVRTSIVSVRG